MGWACGWITLSGQWPSERGVGTVTTIAGENAFFTTNRSASGSGVEIALAQSGEFADRPRPLEDLQIATSPLLAIWHVPGRRRSKPQHRWVTLKPNGTKVHAARM